MNSKMPLEIEKKFLIRMPDLNWIINNTDCKVARISQTYLGLQKDGFGNRIRKIIIDGKTKYFFTSKKSLSDMTRIEYEKEITKKDYYSHLVKKPKDKTLYKTRYIFNMNDLKYELDVYPFWKETAILEIELKDESQSYIIPDFIDVIADVTGNKDYSNSSFVSKYRSLN